MTNSASTRLPPLEKQQITVGFMRLSDSAPLVIAREMGFYERQGLDVSLQREVSWANMRDKLVMGELDAAQMLAPLPLMTSYGAGGIRANLLTGLSLSLNGNAVTLSNRVYQDAGLQGSGGAPGNSARKLKDYLDKRSPTDGLTFATVHLFSSHTFLLRRWLQAGGLDPDRDVRIIVLPPEQMCDSLARGIIDGYCVGEPWNSVAVQQGIGSIAASGYSIWNNAPEKVLSVTNDWHSQHPGTHTRLRMALMQACQTLAEKPMRQQAAEILSQADYLDLPAHYLSPSLTGQLNFRKGETLHQINDFHVFWNYQACFPWRSHARLLMQLCAETLGRPIADELRSSLIQQCYRTDLYRDSARLLGSASPESDYKDENTHVGNWQMAPGIDLGADLMLDTDQ